MLPSYAFSCHFESKSAPNLLGKLHNHGQNKYKLEYNFVDKQIMSGVKT